MAGWMLTSGEFVGAVDTAFAGMTAGCGSGLADAHPSTGSDQENGHQGQGEV